MEERKDEAYIKWKEWKCRDAQNTEERETRLEEKRRKERKWNLYRECSNILEGNKARWLERGRKEKSERLENERKEAKMTASHKKGQETKLEKKRKPSQNIPEGWKRREGWKESRK